MTEAQIFFTVENCLLCFGQTSIDKAEAFLKKKNYIQAERILSSYLNENPNDLKAIELNGDTFGQQEKWDQAIVQYKKLVDAKGL